MTKNRFDHSVRPQDDFFGYVNNHWLENNPIPDDESVWGTFNVLRTKSSKAIKSIIQDINKQPIDSLNADQKLIKKFFNTALNYNRFKTNHLESLNYELQKINNLADKSQLAQYIGQSHRSGFNMFWSNFVGLDDKNSETQVFCFYQGGINLPNRDYYLDKNPKLVNIRSEYERYFGIATNLVAKKSNIRWQNVWGIELALAKASWTDVELRDVEKNYNHYELNTLLAEFPRIDWVTYFQSQNWQKPDDNIVVSQPSFLTKCLQIIDETDLDAIKDYLRWVIINNLVGWIDNQSTKVAFEFYGKVVNGRNSNKPTWKRVVEQTDRLVIGETIGKEYAAKFFPESSKTEVLQIVNDIKSAYHQRIANNTWMTPETIKKAHVKLDNIRPMIGFPSTWNDLSNLNLSDDNHINNMVALRQLESDIDINKIGTKPPIEDWKMNAHTVNAYYDPNNSVICFPAAILQPPFYNPRATLATNLGGIGAVIGHELTHGFDDQGSQFDEKGNVKQWISSAELEKLKQLSIPAIKQADEYESLPGMFLQGNLVVGEIVADIGGLELAIQVLASRGMKNKIALKQLFVNAAELECGAMRDEATMERIKTDPHPPAKFRINCTMAHIDDFYKTYDVKPSDKLYLPPEKRAHIW